MKQTKIFLFIGIHIFILGVNSINIVYGQDKNSSLQHVLIKDNILSRNLTAFFTATNAKVVTVTFSKHDNGIKYSITKIIYLEYVEELPTATWGKWKDYMILFYPANNVRQDSVFTITNKTIFSNLLKYVSSFLPKSYVPPVKYISRIKPIAIKIGSLETPTWTFTVVNGKETFFDEHNGYHFDDITNIPAPENASNTKPTKP